MITWDHFAYFGIASTAMGVIASYCSFFPKKERGLYLFSWLQIVIFASFLTLFWITIERPPFKTMGETRLWFSFFMPVAGLFSYYFWKYKWIIPYSTILSTVFIIINIAKPEIHSKELMPALQSVYFVPHVAIYMFAYAFLGGSFVLGIASLIKKNDNLFPLINSFVLIGISGLGIGMLLGSLWAKEAWGTYWNWDPKETWALVTWFGYLFYYHLRIRFANKKKLAIFVLVFSFLALQVCWYGVNYLPSAKKSIHSYSLK